MNAEAVVRQLGLEPIPAEGGFFKRTWTAGVSAGYPSSDTVGEVQPLGTVIYALFTPLHFSALHRLTIDEVWHFYAGDRLNLVLLRPDGPVVQVRLGPDLQAGETPQWVVPAGTWQGARPDPGGSVGWSLVGCSMAPGFTPSAFTLGMRQELQSAFPGHDDLIRQLTRH